MPDKLSTSLLRASRLAYQLEDKKENKLAAEYELRINTMDFTVTEIMKNLEEISS